MTSQQLKFYKFSNSTTSADKIATAKAVEGAIIYIVDLKEIWIGGATPKLAVAGSTDVSFSANVLTITTHNENGTPTTQTLDFNDVASASQTMAVFQQIYTKMGLTGASHDTIDYSGTNYLSELGTAEHPDKNLVNADKALDTAIHDNTTMAADSAAVYDTEHLSSTWTSVVEANEIEAGDAVTADVEKLDKKVAQLANEVIANEQVTQQAFTAVADSVGLEQDMSLDLSDASSTGAIHNDTDVKSALIHLDNAISTNQLDVQVDGTSIVNNHVANIITEGTYNSSSNKIATESTVSDAIEALDVATDTGAASISGSTITIKAVQQEDGLIKDGGTTTINLDGTYDATDNKIATKSTVTNAINALDVNTDKGAASISGSTITINAVQQEDGLIKDGGSTTINLEGTYNASTNKIATQSTVSNAIDAIAGAGLAVDSAGAITATTQQTSDDQANVATTAFVHDVVETLDTQNDVQAVDYTAATSSTGAKLTFKGVSETDGIIAQGSGATELQFAKVATTGAAEDVSIADSEGHTEQTTVEGAIDEIYDRIEAMEGSFDVIKSVDAGTTPQGVTWVDDSDPQDPQTVTGTLVASADTFHKVYLVKKLTTPTPAPTPETNNTYTEYITTRTNTGTEQAPVYVYGWEKLGDIAIDLTGYVKSVTVNGKTYTVDSNSTNITLTDVITSIVGETEISGGDTNMVKVKAETVKTTADGTNVTTLSTTVKIEEVADGIVKDGTASYTEGHYVIENGKLVSAVGKSTGDTYTISANDGLTKASDVKAYVDTTVETAVTKAVNSTAVYDTTADEISQEWIDVVEGNEIEAGDSFEEDIDKLDNKIAGLADELIRDEEVTKEVFNTVANSVGLEDDLTLDLSGTDIIGGDDSVKEALISLVDYVTTEAGKVDDVKIIDDNGGTGTSIVTNKIANIAVDGTYNASSNKVATQSTVTNAINALDGGVTSDDAAVATVRVEETNGVISDVIVTNVSAGVSYTASTASSAPGLAASTSTGAVTGADIATIKSYVDDAATLKWEEYE